MFSYLLSVKIIAFYHYGKCWKHSLIGKLPHSNNILYHGEYGTVGLSNAILYIFQILLIATEYLS